MWTTLHHQQAIQRVTATCSPTQQLGRVLLSARHGTALLRGALAHAVPRTSGIPAQSGIAGVAAVAGRHAAGRMLAAPSTRSYSSASAPRVCILGGGFGGLYTAIKLESLMWPRGTKPQVTLVDQSEHFVFKPLLYELLNGTARPDEVAPHYGQLLAPYATRFVQGHVAGVEAHEQTQQGVSGQGRVLLEDGEALEYDWLVVALGAEVDTRGVPGVRQNALKFTTLADAQALNSRLGAIEAAGSATAGPGRPVVMVVGAGYAGVELAAVIAERLGGRAVVQIVTPGASILEGSPEGQRAAAEKVLSSLGVQVLSSTKVASISPGIAGDEAASTSATAHANGTRAASATAGANGATAGVQQAEAPVSGGRCTVHLEPLDASSSSGGGGGGGGGGGSGSTAQHVVADVVIWTAGSSPVSKAKKLGLPFPTDARGAIETDATLRVPGHDGVFALGDICGPAREASGAAGAGARGGYPATAQVAFQEADYAAWNIWAAVNGRPLLPFRYQHLGDMMSLGATNAAVALPLSLPSTVSAPLRDSVVGAALRLAGVDIGAGVTLEGPLAQLLRRAAYLYRQPTGEQRLSVAAGWAQLAVELGGKLSTELLGAAGLTRR